MTPTAVQSATTERARALVADRKAEAVALGRETGDLIHDPATLVATLRAGLEALADPEYLAGIHNVAPGIGPVLGVRQPLLHAVTGGLRAATRRDRPTSLLDVAGHLVRDPLLELHWIAYGLLERTIAEEPERTWQLVRTEGRSAGNWICVDTLAHVAARGVLAEPYRWAELEQLVYSPSRWERRLAGSTIATIPHTNRTAGRTPEVVRRGLAIVDDLIGDPEPDVQKALSWALRTLASVDLAATAAILRAETRMARATDDGYRAWVIRDTCEKLPASLAAELRQALSGIRRRPGAPSTSRAAARAADFLAYGLAVPPAERAIIDRT
jgi:3-methyladenine DNA glycosylase AlkD